MSFEKNARERKSRGLRNEIWGLHTLQGEVTEGERGTTRDSEREGDLVSRQVGRDLVLPPNEGGVRKRCWDGEQMVTVARC